LFKEKLEAFDAFAPDYSIEYLPYICKRDHLSRNVFRSTTKKPGGKLLKSACFLLSSVRDD